MRQKSMDSGRGVAWEASYLGVYVADVDSFYLGGRVYSGVAQRLSKAPE